MKVRIEFDENLVEDEVIIRCRQLDKNIQKIQQTVQEVSLVIPRIAFLKQDTEYFMELNSILFFSTADNDIEAHTADEVYNVKYKLYELEEMLPKSFVRISKSTILNTNHVYSIERSLTSTNLVRFYKSHKQVFVSRYYFKELKNRLDMMRQFEREK